MTPNHKVTAATVVGTTATGLSAAFPQHAPIIVAVSTIVTFLLGLFHPTPS